MTDEQLARFLAKVDRSGECWMWTAATYRNGYGHFTLHWRPTINALAHRLAYVHFVGPISADQEIDHVCRNHACVNPAHLEAVSHRENARRGARCLESSHYRDERNRAEHLATLERARSARTPESFARAGAKIRVMQLGSTRSTETKAKMAEARRAYWARKRAVA